jgi:hypothetical protein
MQTSNSRHPRGLGAQRRGLQIQQGQVYQEGLPGGGSCPSWPPVPKHPPGTWHSLPTPQHPPIPRYPLKYEHFKGPPKPIPKVVPCLPPLTFPLSQSLLGGGELGSRAGEGLHSSSASS